MSLIRVGFILNKLFWCFIMYDDLEYVDDLIENGQYPSIHDDIFALHELVGATNVLDVGCCHGLLSHRLGTVYDNVVGIEPSEEYCENLVHKDNVTYYNFEICDENLFMLYVILRKHDIDGVFCRRVISEIYSTGGEELVEDFVNCLVECGVEYVALEGRVKFSNSTHPLDCSDKEVAFFLDDYEEIGRVDEAVALRLR